jgi:hypothetical protein
MMATATTTTITATQTRGEKNGGNLEAAGEKANARAGVSKYVVNGFPERDCSSLADPNLPESYSTSLPSLALKIVSGYISIISRQF